MRRIYEVFSNKEKYMDLLLLGDEQEEMILKYLNRCRLFVMNDDDELCAVCAVTDEGDFTLELKNIAVAESFQRKGIGRHFIKYIEKKFSGAFRELVVGT